ncbi:MAG: hypothetical protein NT015_07360 [Alphaproteobacteria bacterium]|nr:hypothetical protein [Alphaproteobacteria bacterium]
MTPEQNLHTLARRYCEDRIKVCRDLPASIEVARALQAGIEKLDFDHLPPMHEVYAHLKSVVFDPIEIIATTLPGSGSVRPEDPKASKERKLFAQLIERLEKSEIPEQSTLPYRRVLLRPEIDQLKANLKQTWGFGGGYWYPLSEAVNPFTAAFPLVAFALTENARSYLPIGTEVYPGDVLKDVQRFFREHHVKRAYKLRTEWGYSYEIDAQLLDPGYGASEELNFNARHDWVLYWSHEGSVTLGGTITQIVAPKT